MRSKADIDHRVYLRWHPFLLKNSLHHARADAELPADLEDAVAAGLQKVIDPGDVAIVLGFDSHLAVGAVYFFARSSKISIFNFLRS
jgi:hypothetical protein